MCYGKAKFWSALLRVSDPRALDLRPASLRHVIVAIEVFFFDVHSAFILVRYWDRVLHESSLVPLCPPDEYIKELMLQAVKRTGHAATAAIEQVSVDHRRGHVRVAEKFLDRSNVVAGLQ
jgi:hypothetical protein